MEESAAYLPQLLHIAGQMAKQADQTLQEQLGIGLAQYKLLRELQQSPELTQRQIANNLGQTEASISRQTKILAASGLLTVSTNPKSRREHNMTLDAAGHRRLEAADAILQHFYQHIAESLNKKQQAQFAEILEELHTAICRSSHREKA
jgi:DNA-binding MarR family transcriptional regulator